MTGEFLCLVRPDDHVGLFQRPINDVSLEDHLRKIRPEERWLSNILVWNLSATGRKQGPSFPYSCNKCSFRNTRPHGTYMG